MQNLMPQIDTPDNLFHDGNPVTGELGTIVPSEHLNNEQSAIRDVQSEMISVLAAAGIEVDPDKQDQLLTAMKAILLSRKNPFGDIASDGPEAIATALENLGLGGAANYVDLGNGYRLAWVKGNAPGGALAAAAAVAVSLTFTQAFGSTPIIYWSAVSTPSGVTAGAGVISTCADLVATGMSVNLYNASNANKQITAVIGFAIGKM